MKPVKFLIDDENKMIFFYKDGHTEIIYLPTEDGMEQGVPSGLERHKYYSIGEKEFDILKENEKMKKDFLDSLERLAMPDELHVEECKKLGIGLTEDFDIVEQALLELKSIKESDPSKALECLENLFSNVVSTDYTRESSLKYFNTIKNYILKAQALEKEKIIFKHIHNTKVKTPLVSIFNGLNQEERHKFIEHIYYNWEKMKEALEDKNEELVKENTELKAKAQKEHKVLEIIKEYQVDVWLLKQCDYENYIRIRKEAMVSLGQIVNENGAILEDEIPEEYFDLVKRWIE